MMLFFGTVDADGNIARSYSRERAEEKTFSEVKNIFKYQPPTSILDRSRPYESKIKVFKPFKTKDGVSISPGDEQNLNQ